MRHLINTAILLLFVAFPATAQNKNQPKPNVSAEKPFFNTDEIRDEST